MVEWGLFKKHSALTLMLPREPILTASIYLNARSLGADPEQGDFVSHSYFSVTWQCPSAGNRPGLTLVGLFQPSPMSAAQNFACSHICKTGFGESCENTTVSFGVQRFLLLQCLLSSCTAVSSFNPFPNHPSPFLDRPQPPWGLHSTLPLAVS